MLKDQKQQIDTPENEFNFKSIKGRNNINKSVLTQQPQNDLKRQLEPVGSNNYTDSRHFFSFMAQELCYQQQYYTPSSFLDKLENPLINRNNKNGKTQGEILHSQVDKTLINSKPSNKTLNLPSIKVKYVEEVKNDQQNGVNTLKESETDDYSDFEVNNQRVGVSSIQYYYDKLKNLERSVEKNKHKQQAPVAYLKKCEDQKLIPSPFGMVSLKGPLDTINLKQFRIGNKYADSLGSGLKLSQAISKVNLASNRLSPQGGISILKGLNPQIQELDLSNNDLGNCTQLPSISNQKNHDPSQLFIEQLNEVLHDRQLKIQVLNLNKNKISDIHVNVICEALMVTSNKSLRVLSLNENLITDFGCESISEMLDVNSTNLKELKLNWNHIQAQGGIKIANSLKSNNQLRVLDLGWNSIGSGGKYKSEVGTVWGSILQENKYIQHLDLSFNKLLQPDVDVFLEKIKNNHTIYGLHFQGNEGRTDSLGFIRAVQVSQQSVKIVIKS